MRQEFHQDAWQFQHSSDSRHSDYLRSDTKPGISEKTDWQHPTSTTDDA